MSYKNCCCSKLNQITQTEIKKLRQSSSKVCAQNKEEWIRQCQQYQASQQKQCQTWNRWIRWLCIFWTLITTIACILWVWIKVIICIIWTTITNIFWTLAGYSSIYLCSMFGVEFAVGILNNILKINLYNNLLLGFGVGTPPNPVVKPGWNPTFSDEFNGTTLDTDKWYTKMLDRPNLFNDYEKYINSNVVPPYYFDDSAIEVSGGTVKLKIEYHPETFDIRDWNGPINDPNTGLPYQVTINHKMGVLLAKQKVPWCDPPCDEKTYSQRFGFFEIRCRMPQSKATWPAFWLSGTVCWPPEIDVFEILTSMSFSVMKTNYHWGKENYCFDHASNDLDINTNNLSNEFHNFGCEWDSCFIKWYYDNQLVRVAHKNVTNVFEPMNIIVGAGIDDMNNKSKFEPYQYSLTNNRLNKLNYEDELTLPSVFEVDYVRAYTK